jgi:hypothetical protein
MIVITFLAGLMAGLVVVLGIQYLCGCNRRTKSLDDDLPATAHSKLEGAQEQSLPVSDGQSSANSDVGNAAASSNGGAIMNESDDVPVVNDTHVAEKEMV